MSFPQELKFYFITFAIFGRAFKKPQIKSMGWYLHIAFTVLMVLVNSYFFVSCIFEVTGLTASQFQYNVTYVVFATNIISTFVLQLCMIYMSYRGTFMPDHSNHSNDPKSQVTEISSRVNNMENNFNTENNNTNQHMEQLQGDDEFLKIHPLKKSFRVLIIISILVSFTHSIIWVGSLVHKYYDRYFVLCAIGLDYADNATSFSQIQICSGFAITLFNLVSEPVNLCTIFYLAAYVYILSLKFQKLHEEMGKSMTNNHHNEKLVDK